MRKKLFSVVIVITLFAGLILNVTPAAAKDLTVQEIVERAYTAAYYGGEDGRSTVEMTIVDDQNRKRNRKLTMLRKDIKDNGEQMYYAYFHEPADVRKMVYMVKKHVGTQDDRWLYLPAMDLVRRIAATDKRSSFVGSHFTYEDISGRNINLDKHELLKETEEQYILKHIPKNKGNVKFSYYKMWVDKDNFIPVKSKYFDKQGNPYRLITAEKVENIQGYPTVTVMKAKNLETGGYTINRFVKVEYDIGIPSRIFGERYLRRAPRRWLR